MRKEQGTGLKRVIFTTVIETEDETKRTCVEVVTAAQFSAKG